MSNYIARVGRANIQLLLNGSMAARSSLLVHVASEEDTIDAGYGADTILFDEKVMQFLQGLPDGVDGWISEDRQLFIAGVAYDVAETGIFIDEGQPAVTDDELVDRLEAWERDAAAHDLEGDEPLEVADEGGNT